MRYPYRMPKPLVYLVDDSSTVRALAPLIEGYLVRAFADWTNLMGVYKTAADRPVALVADISVPRPDTIEMLREHRIPELPLVIMSGHSMGELLGITRTMALHGGYQVTTVRKAQDLPQRIRAALDLLLTPEPATPT